MKKDPIFPADLTCTQDQIAALLNTHRSQYSMYIKGRRDLPAESKSILASILSHIIEAPLPESNHTNEFMPLWETMYQENEFKLIILEKKLQKMLANFKTAHNTLHLVKNLQKESSLFEQHERLLDVLQQKALEVEKNNNLKKQALMKFKIEKLMQEQKLLRTKMQKKAR